MPDKDKKALIVGIDHYRGASQLYGCVNDASQVASILSTHQDGHPNFDVRLMEGQHGSPVNRADLRQAVIDLFADNKVIALLYFAGHGHIESTGGYLWASDTTSGAEGLPLWEVLQFANDSLAQNRIIILDSCHAGILGKSHRSSNHSELGEGLTILAASTEKQYATEAAGAGVFTSLMIDALEGAAANLVGEITPGSVYAHIDQSLGGWDQRPVFKTNVKSFVSLRRVAPPVAPDDLRRLTSLFPSPGHRFALDPTFEPERHPGSDPTIPPPDPAHTEIFALLQRFNRARLLVPVGAPHMWHAAMQSKACRLTTLGEHYRRLVEKRHI